MNDFQLVRRIARIAQSHRWQGDPTGGLVWPLGSVIVSGQLTIEIFRRNRKPLLTILPAGAQANDEFPDLKTSSVSMVLATSVPNDKDGSLAILGGLRPDVKSSKGAGLLQLQAELGLVADLLSGKQGVNLISVADSAARTEVETDVGFIAWRELVFEAQTTTEYSDAPAEFLQATGTAPVVLTWRAPFDASGLIEYRVRRVSGEVPAVFVDDGTDIGTTTNLTINDTPGSGSWTYSVFAMYDAVNAVYPITYSDCATLVVKVP